MWIRRVTWSAKCGGKKLDNQVHFKPDWILGEDGYFFAEEYLIPELDGDKWQTRGYTARGAFHRISFVFR